MRGVSSLRPWRGYAAAMRGLSASDASAITRVGVIGLGLMGHGIVQKAAWCGFEVVAVEKEAALLACGEERIEQSVAKVLKSCERKTPELLPKETLAAVAAKERIQYSTELESLADVDLVVEAIVEDMAVKTPLYQSLASITRKDCILATNTSSLPVQLMADASGRQERTVGLHFFNPVQKMKLVEVVKLDTTEPAVFEACMDFSKKLGKVPVACVDTPGFIVNRLLVPALAQAMLMLERGEASAEDIDTAMQLGAGHPMGPLTLADYVGLDTCKFILEGWVEKFPNEPAFMVPESLKAKVAEGKLGRKTGEGFFRWDGMKRV